MSDTVTQVTMWQDATGSTWPTQDQAINANNVNDLSAYMQNAISSGNANAQPLAGFSVNDVRSIAALILAGYTLTAIA